MYRHSRAHQLICENNAKIKKIPSHFCIMGFLHGDLTVSAERHPHHEHVHG